MARRVCRAVLILPDWVHCPRPGKHVQSRDGLLVWAASIAWIASAPEVHGLLCLVQGKENDTAKPGAAHAQRCAPRPARRLPALPVPDGALLAQRWPSGVCHMHLPKATTPGERVRVGLSCRHPPPPSRMPPSLSLSRSLSPPFSLLGRMLALVGRPYARPGPAPPEALTAKFCTGASSWQDAFVSGTKPANVLSGVAHSEQQRTAGADGCGVHPACILRASCAPYRCARARHGVWRPCTHALTTFVRLSGGGPSCSHNQPEMAALHDAQRAGRRQESVWPHQMPGRDLRRP